MKVMRLYAIILFFSCNSYDKESKQKSPDYPSHKSSDPTQLRTNHKAQILNNIVVHENGLKLSRAFLAYQDGTLVSQDNYVSPNTAVYLNLHIDSGFIIKNNMAAIGASEQITTDKGEKVINITDLFSDTPAIASQNAKQIQLKATITKTRQDIHYFIIHYKVWDKLSGADVTGSYSLYISYREDDTD